MLTSPMEAQIVDLTAPPAVQAAVADRAANLPVVDAAAADGNTRVESAQDPPPGLPVRSEQVVDVGSAPQPPNHVVAAAEPSTTLPPAMQPTDPWAAFTNKRLSEAKEPRVKDVGTHLPSMDELQPLIQKHAEGTLAFYDTMPIQKHCQREIVGWLHMDTGNHTKAINEDAAMASLLRDNQSIVNSETLVDVVKCEKDPQNRMLRWGIASDKALRQLQGATLKLRIQASGKGKGTTLVPFQLGLPHALEGFYMDIPVGLQGVLEERLLFDTM
ncbi:hypothetical protein As57867_019451, partial [Aphanomyces stellatus]